MAFRGRPTTRPGFVSSANDSAQSQVSDGLGQLQMEEEDCKAENDFLSDYNNKLHLKVVELEEELSIFLMINQNLYSQRTELEKQVQQLQEENKALSQTKRNNKNLGLKVVELEEQVQQLQEENKALHGEHSGTQDTQDQECAELKREVENEKEKEAAQKKELQEETNQ
ncbi:uncharacterized protein LOC133442512 [Cololabis saira]|uniref:uncharacterized protein LOC133442512 n=1 Tax=Cololabis saira TaxID=129043 RepID=UPI002AD376C4|nr:uncharacterized protein LOC133442512 [Cololabis saira]